MNETPKNDPTPSVPPPPAGWSSASGTASAGDNPWATQTAQTAQAAQAAQAAQPEQPAAHTTPFGTPAGAGTPPPSAAAEQVAPAEPGKKRRRAGTLVAGLAIGAILGGGAGAAVFNALDDDTTTPATSTDTGSNDGEGSAEPAQALDNVESVADQVQPSVVSISAQTQMGEGGGSGIVLSADGEILTNNHVVQGADTVTVTFSDGTTADAEVVGTDPDTDLAVIKAKDVSGLTPADLGNSGELAVGEQVVAIGSPLGLEGTVTTGIVSALQRPVQAGEQQPGGQGANVYDAIQTDAPINPGNSGGPLVNMAGQVVGINSAILTDGSSQGSIGLGFSIPIDQAKPIVDELRDSGEATHALFGVGLSGDPQDGTRGALLASVDPDTAADKAGLQKGDIVTKVDDRLITDSTELVAAARSYRPGDTVTVTYVRDGDEHTTEVTLGSDAETT